MDKKDREILEEVINNLNSLKARVAALEKEVAGLRGEEEPVSDVNEVIDIEIDDLDLGSVGLGMADSPEEPKLRTFDDFLADFEPKDQALAVEEAPAEEPVVEETIKEAPVEVLAEQTVEDETSVEEAVAEEAPVLEASPVEEAPAEEPVVEETVEEAPAEEPVVEEAVEEAPAEEPVVEETIEEAPVEEPVVEETIEEAPVEEPVVEETVEEAPVEEPVVEEAVEEESPVVEEVVEETPVEEPVEEAPVEEEPALFGDMSLFGTIEEVPVKRTRKSHKTLNDSAHSDKAVIDVMAEKMAWKHDMPGSEVKDIKSAISLNDRVLFISSLFREDSMLYQDTMHKLNAMSALGEAVRYLKETFPEWNWESESVYRFMMAVRRKLR